MAAYHQNQWLAAIEDLKAEGLEDAPVPSNFPQERKMGEVAYKFINFSEGEESAELYLGSRAVLPHRCRAARRSQRHAPAGEGPPEIARPRSPPRHGTFT